MTESDNSIQYCIFDMDGLLLDTERVYSEVSNEILSRYGKEFTWELKAQMMGRNQKDATKLFIDTHNLPITAEEYLTERNRLQNEKFPHCKPLPGVMRLIKHLKQHKIPIAVATSSHHKAFLVKSQNNQELFSLFDQIICGDNPNVLHGKPAPDIFLEAAQQLGAKDSKKCLVFEDAIPGVQAGVNAQMKTIWIPDPKLLEMAGSDIGATQILTSMEEFQPELFGLPPFH
ncbi:HAD-like protein [Neoconidiobolus thromboides FSU 785]|nr:HAD-like protein [Neoconidiobolus thromboides FSU 785]